MLPDALRAQLAREIGRLRDAARDVAWVAEHNLHVTLKFLGQLDPARIPAVGEVLREAVSATPPFELGVRGLGAFPSTSRARVIWAGLEPAEPLAAVAARIDAGLAALGLEPESRPFAAHVTLGRVREPRRNAALVDALARPADLGRLSVTRVSLMRSELHPAGARYSELVGVLLGSAPSSVE